MNSKWYRHFIAGVSVVAMSAAASLAVAQEAETETVTEDSEARLGIVEVTGFRGSLAEALDVKREASGVVDAIVAEDIAAFPDLNLAESIQRVPGVSISRVAGEGRQITVRGLGADFTRVRINGMEALSTTGGSDSSGGTNRGRGFDFNTFASDLFNEIRVTKTTSASIEEGSLGATVDLMTARPFDYDPGFTAAGSTVFGYNDLSEQLSPRLAGLMSWSNDDQTFGALFSAAFTDRTILEEGFSTVRWQDSTFRSVSGGDGTAIDGSSGLYHPRIPRYGRLTNEQQRLGLTGSLQFRPTNNTTVSLDGLYSSFEANRTENYLEVFFRSQTGVIDVDSYTVNPDNNTIESGTFTISENSNGTHPIRSEARYDEMTTDFTQLTLNVDHDFTDRLRGNFLAGMVESKYDNPVQTTLFFDAVGDVSGYSYDFSQSSTTPTIDFGSLDVTDPSQFLFTEFRDRPNSVDNSFETFAGSLEYDFSDSIVLSGGVSLKTFEFDTTEARRESTYSSRVCELPNNNCATGANGLPITSDMVNMLTGLGSGLGMPGSNDTSWIVPNVGRVASLIGVYDIAAAVQSNNTRAVEEEDLGGWVQADFETEIAGMFLRGDIGARYVETTTAATGLISGTEATIERSYEDFLPSLNLALEPNDDIILRFSVAKVMSRPSLGNLTPGGSLGTFSADGETFNGEDTWVYNTGNPGLEPYRATNFDASFEWYFDEEALIALSVFYKDVDSFFTRSQPTYVRFSQSGLTLANAGGDATPLGQLIIAGGDPYLEINQVQNGDAATLQGFELAYQQPFTFLPGFWSDFGFQGNYTYVESDEILGFSPNAYNATLYYENDTFSARLSAAYRDAYVTREANSAGRDERGYDSSFNLDFASSWSYSDQIDFTFEAINLTDEFEQQIFDAADLINVYHHTGTEFLFGARYKY
ncbi:TonB-dependent receptor [Ponticaulis sp.]|uniref:TonB-dependent receptor n=1 Tax=Ponticaulis sp. TaxID=2020902 RepID=UPI0025F0B5D1|nr:TonB-dependent receptor [Ponticaulis sp.]|tara:strand:- start:45018 stop:47798 length:2781 start_codon:yes stop_codon:yes gene_type:complete